MTISVWTRVSPTGVGHVTELAIQRKAKFLVIGIRSRQIILQVTLHAAIDHADMEEIRRREGVELVMAQFAGGWISPKLMVWVFGGEKILQVTVGATIGDSTVRVMNCVPMFGAVTLSAVIRIAPQLVIRVLSI